MEIQFPQRIYHTTLTLIEHEWASFEDGALQMRVRAFEQNEYVNIESEIREVIKGAPMLKGIPVVLTQWKKQAEVVVKEKDKSLKFRLKVTPYRD